MGLKLSYCESLRNENRHQIAISLNMNNLDTNRSVKGQYKKPFQIKFIRNGAGTEWKRGKSLLHLIGLR